MFDLREHVPRLSVFNGRIDFFKSNKFLVALLCFLFIPDFDIGNCTYSACHLEINVGIGQKHL